jgi:hypothetical protein
MKIGRKKGQRAEYPAPAPMDWFPLSPLLAGFDHRDHGGQATGDLPAAQQHDSLRAPAAHHLIPAPMTAASATMVLSEEKILENRDPMSISLCPSASGRVRLGSMFTERARSIPCCDSSFTPSAGACLVRSSASGGDRPQSMAG